MTGTLVNAQVWCHVSNEQYHSYNVWPRNDRNALKTLKFDDTFRMNNITVTIVVPQLPWRQIYNGIHSDEIWSTWFNWQLYGILSSLYTLLIDQCSLTYGAISASHQIQYVWNNFTNKKLILLNSNWTPHRNMFSSKKMYNEIWDITDNKRVYFPFVLNSRFFSFW